MEAPILETTIDDLGLPLSFPTCSYLEDALCGKAMGDAAPADSDGMPAFLMPMALPRVPGTTNPPTPASHLQQLMPPLQVLAL